MTLKNAEAHIFSARLRQWVSRSLGVRPRRARNGVVHLSMQIFEPSLPISTPRFSNPRFVKQDGVDLYAIFLFYFIHNFDFFTILNKGPKWTEIGSTFS